MKVWLGRGHGHGGWVDLAGGVERQRGGYALRCGHAREHGMHPVAVTSKAILVRQWTAASVRSGKDEGGALRANNSSNARRWARVTHARRRHTPRERHSARV